jgi:glycosyltransferase involved in cell wall biosynthesis
MTVHGPTVSEAPGSIVESRTRTRSRMLMIGSYRFPHGDATSCRLLQLARSTGRDQDTTVVVNDWPCDGSRPPEGYPEGIQLITLQSRGRSRASRAALRLARPWRTLRALKRHGIDRADIAVVCLPMAMMTVGTWLVLRTALRCPIVVDATERHDRQQFRRGWLTPYFARHRWSTFLATRLAHRVTAVSETLAAYFGSRGLEALVVPPQVDHTEFRDHRRPSLRPALRLLYAGTPGRKDMLDPLLAGIGQLPPDLRSRVTLLVAGISRDEAAGSSSLSQSTLAAVEPNVTFLGRVPRSRVLELLADSHFSVLIRPDAGYASYGFPSKVPESLAAGCPVFLNHTSDLARYIRDGEVGIVVGGPDQEDVRLGLERALALDEEAWADMSRAARDLATRSFDHRVWRHSVGQFVRSHQATP